jgi:phosphatidylserine decarboxylase
MTLKNLTTYFHPAGRVFIGLFAVGAFFLHYVGGIIFVISLVLTAWCAYFFRDPTRTTPRRVGLIISPADGRVVAIKELVPDADLGLGDEARSRISIFLNIFDVHVNRIPADGIVRARQYRQGKFFNASLDKASEHNERMALTLQLTGDHPYENRLLGVVQIAGLIARRILCATEEGETVKAGERYGIIRFGSRVDIYLPPGLPPHVVVGQYMIGGETVLADCASTEPARHGEFC